MSCAHPLGLSIRVAHPGDVHWLERAERECFPDPWPAQLLAAELMAPGRFHRVLVDRGGELVAYLLSAWQYLDLHVLKVATLPHWRRQGLARRLMILAEQHCAEMGGESVTLEVRAGNRAAAAMYESLGYARAGQRPHYYLDGEDAVIMTRRMQPGGRGGRP